MTHGATRTPGTLTATQAQRQIPSIEICVRYAEADHRFRQSQTLRDAKAELCKLAHQM